MDEFLALAYHQERGLDCVIVRLFNTVGPRQSGQYGMVIPRFVERALAGRAARDPRRRDPDALLLPRADTVRALTGADGRARSRAARSTTSARRSDQHPRPRRSGCARRRARGPSPFVPYEEVYGLGIEDMHHRVPATEKIVGVIGWRPTLDLDVVLADVIKHCGRPAPPGTTSLSAKRRARARASLGGRAPRASRPRAPPPRSRPTGRTASRERQCDRDPDRDGGDDERGQAERGRAGRAPTRGGSPRTRGTAERLRGPRRPGSPQSPRTDDPTDRVPVQPAQ